MLLTVAATYLLLAGVGPCSPIAESEQVQQCRDAVGHCRGKAVPAKQDSIVTSSAQVTGLSGYWAKHAGKTTPAPFPLDLLLGVGYFGRKAHESIQGIKVGICRRG